MYFNLNPKSNMKITKNKLRINFYTSNCLASTVLTSRSAVVHFVPAEGSSGVGEDFFSSVLYPRK